MNESQIACWLLLGILPYRIAMDDKVGSAYSLSIRALFWAVTIERHWYGDVEWSIRVPLIERLREDRVRKVVEPVLTGEGVGVSFQSDDARYVVDLGLLRTDRGTWEAANPIYREVIARALSFDQQTAMPPELRNRWISDDGLDMTGLLKAFQAFWRENSDIWIEKYDYREAAPHLILQAFLQRVVNGGARIDREFALGRQRLDLCVTIGDHRYPVELKVRDPRRSDPEPVGIVQLGEYMDTCGATEGWLVIFDQRRELPWDERIGWKRVAHDGRTIHVVRC